MMLSRDEPEPTDPRPCDTIKFERLSLGIVKTRGMASGCPHIEGFDLKNNVGSPKRGIA